MLYRLFLYFSQNDLTYSTSEYSYILFNNFILSVYIGYRINLLYYFPSWNVSEALKFFINMPLFLKCSLCDYWSQFNVDVSIYNDRGLKFL